ncbi:MAG: phage holin family protein [Paracoccaceae bacterium]|nr:phage holin family protein [Loktanella sp.]
MTTRTPTNILSDVMNNASRLVRREVDLARAEVDENLRQAAVAIGLIVAAIVILLVALNVLAGALVAAITELGVPAGWSALIVGGVFAVIAILMLLKGKNDLSATSLAPTKSARNLRRDAMAVKEATQ